MNVWQLITNASSLPVQPGTTLWDHLNNLSAGGGLPIPLPVFYQSIEVDEGKATLVQVEQLQTTFSMSEYDSEISLSESDLIEVTNVL